MTRLIHEDHNLRVNDLPSPIKALITKLENAIDAYSWSGSRPPEDREELKEAAQIARYNLEQAIATQIKKSRKEMTHWTQITAENALGEQCSLSECEIFCTRAGENDYGDPAAIRFPKSDGIIQLSGDYAAPRFYDQDGNSVSSDEIDWEGAEPSEEFSYPRTRKFQVELSAWESVLVTVEVEQTADMDEGDVIEAAQKEALEVVDQSEDPTELGNYSHSGWSYAEVVIEKTNDD